MKEYDQDRIEKLRQEAVSPVINYNPFHIAFYDHYLENLDRCGMYEAYGEAVVHAYASVVPVIGDGELIVGRCSTPSAGPEEDKHFQEIYHKAIEVIETNGQDSHMAIDYELLLTQGVVGVIQRIRSLIEKTEDPDKIAYYRCCEKALFGATLLADRYSACAFEQARVCQDPVRKQELEQIGLICSRVPRYPASSFYEAVQSAHFMSFCLSMSPHRLCSEQFQLGRPDRYLYPYYQKDLENGVITKEFARTLMDCLGIQINNRVPRGLSCGWMVGGRDKNGQVVANDLTSLGIQVVDDIRLVYPSVGLCYTQGTPDELLQQACETLSHGRSHPAIFNDDVISAGLREYGVPEDQCHDYIHSTCVEITPIGGSNIWVASPYTNLPQILLDVMDREYGSYDELMQAYFAKLAASIKANYEEFNGYRYTRAKTTINPLLSCFVHDCLERGVDIEAGGARYNWIMPSFVGMANLVDSLYVLKTVVFDQQEMTIARMKQLVDSNFQGQEALRLHLLNDIPKYGNDIDDVDCLAQQIVNFLVSECKKYTPAFSGAHLVPSVFCWVMHEYFGTRTGATPDGRPANFPLGDGSGPCQGRELCGPTASILSSTKWSHQELIGGVAVNLKFSRKVFSEDSYQKMMALIKTYLMRGGFELQINVTDHETLKKARENPEQYRDLVVRIGGYSDYFVCLSPQMQEEVMLRTEHDL